MATSTLPPVTIAYKICYFVAFGGPNSSIVRVARTITSINALNDALKNLASTPVRVLPCASI
jgi:hypothetical protein